MGVASYGFEFVGRGTSKRVCQVVFKQNISLLATCNVYLGAGLKHVLVIPTAWEMIRFDEDFPDGLKRPARYAM